MDPRPFFLVLLVAALSCGCLQTANTDASSATLPAEREDSAVTTIVRHSTTTSPQDFCIDSDGFNVFSGGKTGGISKGVQYENADECLSQVRVGEWVCENKTGYASMIPTECPKDHVCSQGICVKAEYGRAVTTTLRPASLEALFSEQELAYGTVLYATAVGGDLVYSVDDGRKTAEGIDREHLVYDGRDEGIQYDYAKAPVDVGGKLAYVAAKSATTFIVYDRKAVGMEYDICTDPADVGGRLAYAASMKNNKTAQYYIVYDGTETPVKYAAAKKPFGVGGRLGYMAYRGVKWFIYLDGKVIGEDYDSIDNPLDIGGKLAYEATQSGKSFIVYDGREGEKYDYVYGLTEINGEPVYVAEDGADNFLVYGGLEDRKGYEAVMKPVPINGKVHYAARKSDGGIVIVYGGDVIETDYSSIVPDLVNLKGRLAFLARRDGVWYLVKER